MNPRSIDFEARPELKPSLFVLSWQFGLTGLLRSRMIASFVLFFLPVVLSGFYLQYREGFVIFTRGITTMLVWLGLPRSSSSGFFC
ncbi:MAG: hypothetical protein ABIF77_20905 [bacterium]